MASLWSRVWPAGDNLRRWRGQVEAREDLEYGAEPRQKLDLYLPKGGPPHPLAVFVHGGLWQAQDRKLLRPLTGLYSNVGAALAGRGIVAAVVGYRQHPLARDIDDSLADLAAAVAFVHTRSRELGGDGSLALIGHSAGAQLIAELALEPGPLQAAGVEPRSVRALVGLCGYYDVERMLAALPGARQRAVMHRLFGADEAARARRSPERKVRKDAPPTLLLAAGRDMPALLQAHAAMHAAIAAVGGKVTSAVLPNRGHMGLVIEMGRREDEVTPQVAAFIRDACR